MVADANGHMVFRKDKAITAIKEALADPSPNFNCKSVQARLATAWGYVKAQPEQEPVACVTYKEVADTMNGLWGGTLVQRQIAEELENTMLYTTSPQRTWVGLTDIDYAGLPLEQVGLVRWAEAKLKEKNT